MICGTLRCRAHRGAPADGLRYGIGNDGGLISTRPPVVGELPDYAGRALVCADLN